MSDSAPPPTLLLPVLVGLFAVIPCALGGFFFLRCNGRFR